MPRYAYMINIDAPSDHDAKKLAGALQRWGEMFPQFNINELYWGSVPDDHEFVVEESEVVDVEIEEATNVEIEGDAMMPYVPSQELMDEVRDILDNAPRKADDE